MTLDRRQTGVLLHPTSLPGRFGIGDLGPQCDRFLDWMKAAGLGVWQTLPLGPTGFGDSPYQCFSAFAGNPMLVSPELLLRDGLLSEVDIEPAEPRWGNVEYGPVIDWKTHLLRLAFERFQRNQPKHVVKRFETFRKSREVKSWLEDYALFRVLKDMHGGRSWDQWDPEYRKYEKKALKKVLTEKAAQIEFHMFAQFLFFDQWEAVRAKARERNITIVGDAPIYVAYDSTDTWANQEIFHLDAKGHPVEVAGVPPDYFSATGQLWGNPLYNWKKLQERKYDWWIERLQAIFKQVDIVRLDHFRGFAGFWAVPFGEKTAENGEWRRGPGSDFFKVLQRRFREMPIIAEDLGEITPDVIELRDEFNLPGMKVLQFAWGIEQRDPIIPSPAQGFQPHNQIPNCVVYTGTHDNDTTIGWYNESSEEDERHHMRVYLATDGKQPNWDLIRAAFRSTANTAIVPMQDFLNLGSECRMNYPGRAEGNWTWRFHWDQLSGGLTNYISELNLLYQRHSNPPECALPSDDPKKRNYLAD